MKNLSALTGKLRRASIWIAIKAKGYYASLLTVGVVMPVIASFIAVGIYLFSNPPILGCNDSHTVGCNNSLTLALHSLVLSSLFTGLLWFVVAIPAYSICTARGANPRNYTLLCSRLHQLQAKLGLNDDSESTEDITNALKAKGLDEKKDRHAWNVVKEACVCCVDISQKLCKYPAGRTWNMGTEYNTAWMLLHHAEEAMIEVADFDTLMREAKHDFLAIQGSQIDKKDALLADILRAVAALKLPLKEAETYLKEQQPDKLSITVGQLTELIHRPGAQSPCVEVADTKKEEALACPGRSEMAARGTLREVRSTLNAYRDKRWGKFVGQRSQLMKAIVVTGIVTYAFVCFVLANGPQPSLILASTLFYMIGAGAGLFLRFYRESQGSTSTDDFGLSTIRLLSIPLLSGLAGIAGAIAVILLPDLTIQAHASGIPTTISDLLTPQILLTAAAFGASPNLVIRGLKEKADKYESELRSSKAAEPTS